MIVYGIHFSTAAYFWAKWVVQRMFMRFEQHTIFLTYPKTPFAQSEFSPLLWKMSLGHGMHLNDKNTRQAGCFRNIQWPSGSIQKQRGQHPFQVKSWRSCRLQVLQTHMFGYGMGVEQFHFIAFQLNVCWIKFLNTGLLYDMQLKSLMVSQAWWSKTHQLWIGILYLGSFFNIGISTHQYWKNRTGNGDPLLRLRQSVGEDSPYYVMVISHRSRRAFFLCPEHCHQKIKFNLVGGFNPSEKYYCSQLGWLFPIYGEMKKRSKPPTSNEWINVHPFDQRTHTTITPSGPKDGAWIRLSEGSCYAWKKS